jgi:YidC/Oxa1 family membrane protein insertase
MQQQEPTNFMDKRTIMAILLMGVVFFGWQKYMTSKYPEMGKPVTTTTTPGASANSNAQVGTPGNVIESPPPRNTVEAAPITAEEKTARYEDEAVAFDISSFGMGLKHYTLKSYTTREKQPILLGESSQRLLFATSLLGSRETLNFNLQKVSDTVFEGVAQVGAMTIKKVIEVIPGKSAVKIQTIVTNADGNFRGLVISMAEPVQNLPKGSFFMPSYEHQDFVVSHTGTMDRVNSTSSPAAVDQTFNSVGMIGVSSQYFASALLDKSDIIPEVKVTGGLDAKDLVADLIYKPASLAQSMEFNVVGFAGPKSAELLKSVDAHFYDLIDFGWFATIAKVLLHLLRWFHEIIPNWGVAIVLLTLLVRMLVLPFNVSSYKSMKKMQVIQPLVKQLQEKYKDKPELLNAEMMKLWKEHKVNPVGGCLPMFLQLPIFFALFQVLGQAIELYQAPFFGWIHDLSLRDPWFVLPVLMAGAMFLQQKMTPTTMDPAQAKIMQFVVLLFAIPMAFFPSGLALYTCVSTIFGIIQQRIFMRDTSKQSAVAVKSAKA